MKAGRLQGREGAKKDDQYDELVQENNALALDHQEENNNNKQLCRASKLSPPLLSHSKDGVPPHLHQCFDQQSESYKFVASVV